MQGHSAKLVGNEHRFATDVAAAHAALTDAVKPLAIGRTASAAAARELLDIVRHHGAGSSPQQFIGLYLATARARAAARRSFGAGYDWTAWAEVSRLSEECLIASLGAMRAARTPHEQMRGSEQALADPHGGAGA